MDVCIVEYGGKFVKRAICLGMRVRFLQGAWWEAWQGQALPLRSYDPKWLPMGVVAPKAGARLTLATESLTHQ